MNFFNSGTHGVGSRSYTRDRYTQYLRGTSINPSLTDYSPEDFGAIGDGVSHTARDVFGVHTIEALRAYAGGIYWFATDIGNQVDWLGWQAALYAGGRLTARPEAHYWIQDMLTVVTGRTAVDATRAILDFTQMVAASTATNLIPSPDFSAGWANTATSPRTDWVFGAGVATFTDPAPGTGTSFGQMGRQITIPAGRWRVEFTVSMTVGASAGLYGLPICGLGWYADGIGLGELTYPDGLEQTQYTTAPTTIHRDFELDEPLTVYVVWSAFNANVVISAPRLKPFLFNAAIWATGDGAVDDDSDKQDWLGGRIFGPGRTSGIAGFLQKSFSGRSSQIHLHGTEIGMRTGKGFAGAIYQSDQAYLSSINHCSIGYCFPAWKFERGAVNAGENLVIHRCTLFNEGAGIDLDGGSALRIYGTSLDYHATDQAAISANNQALITGAGVHIEQEAKSVEAIQLRGGSKLQLADASIVQAGAATATAQAYALVESNLDELGFDALWCYGALTASDTFARGAGRVRIGQFMGPGNANIPGMLIRNFTMDRFGGSGRMSGPVTASDMTFPTPPDGIGFACGIYAAGVPMARLDTPLYASGAINTGYGRVAGYGSLALTVDPAWAGGGTGFTAFYPVSEGRLAFDEFYWAKPAVVAPIASGPFAVANSISTTAGSNVITITDAGRQFSGGEGPQTGWTVTIAGSAAVGGIAAGSINGTRTVIARTGGTSWTVQAGAAASSSVANGGGAGVTLAYSQTSVRIFDRRFWVAVIGQDAAGRPLIGQNLFTGETDFDVPFAATGFTRKGMHSWYAGVYVPADPMGERYGDGRAPAWATHMAMRLDFQHMRFPAVPLYVTDYLANC